MRRFGPALVLLALPGCYASYDLRADAVPPFEARDDDGHRPDDAGLEIGPDADAAVDDARDDTPAEAPVDADADEGADDVDGGCTPLPPLPLAPENGALTGSPWGTALGTALRPLFRWRPADGEPCGAIEFEFQLDDSCPPADPASCTFPSPEYERRTADGSWRPEDDLPVSWEPPVGRRYLWRVRACAGAACSSWSLVRYLDVGRVRADFDGDGYSDVVVGAHWQDAYAVDEGSAFVYLGSPDGVSNPPDATLPNPAGLRDGYFGVALDTAGDVNADGFADLIVGADWQSELALREGAAYLYLGGPDGIRMDPDAALPNPDHATTGLFGISVAGAGDVDADGFADVVVGAAGQAGMGRAYVFLGRADGLPLEPSWTLAAPEPQPDAAFGASVAGVGDTNADGFADVLVGAFRQDGAAVDEGRAWLFAGDRAGPEPTPLATLAAPDGEFEAHFGRSVGAAGDVTEDGYADVLVGAFGVDDPARDSGTAYFYRGAPEGLLATGLARWTSPAGREEDYFGIVVVGVGDFECDGYPDVAVGAPRVDSPMLDEGNVYVYGGNPDWPDAEPSVTLDDPENRDGSWFGSSVAAAGDVNGDGCADLIVGAPWQSGDETSEGVAFLWFGGTGGIAADPDVTLPHPTPQAWALFGSSVL